MGKASRRNKVKKPKKVRIDFVDRPFEGLAFEPELVAMREIIPAATLPVKTTDEYGAEELLIVTVLPGMVAATRREDGMLLVAAQTVANSGDLSLDIADRILKGQQLGKGDSLQSTDPVPGPRLQDILDLDYATEMELHSDFNFWVDPAEREKSDVQAAIAQSAEQLIPTEHVDNVEGAFWCRMQREFVRWVRPEPEAQVLDALARLHTKRELSFDGGRFVGAFRAHGLLIPVFELDAGMEADELAEPMAAFTPAFEEALADTEPLNPDERRARSGIISRQVTLR
ncbi:MAG: topoisomerase II [Actinomycetaceae bacterium]|nr:topoisomerase II [Actinomycetaceae bacterium]